MNRKDFIGRVYDALYDNGIRKPVSIKKSTFRISDDGGQDAEFTVKRQDKQVAYTIADITNIVDACIAVIVDAIKHGESVVLRNFGTFSVRRYGQRIVNDPLRNTRHIVKPRCAAKFIPGKDLKLAATLFQVELDDRENGGDA